MRNEGVRELVDKRELVAITGCMFSGKTDDLIGRLERKEIAREPVLLFKPSIDDRCGLETTETHYGGRSFSAILLEPGKETLEELERLAGIEAVRRARMIAFEEGEFFSDKLPVLCEQLVAMGKQVAVAGLNLDFRGQPFGPMPIILALADEAVTHHAVCVKCGREATRTQRLTEDGKPAPINGPLIQVGGKGAYEARCRRCWNDPSL